MDTAILVIWWVGLLAALVPTLVILKEVVLMLSTLRAILTLSGIIETAARGIVEHVDGLGRLGERASAEHLPERTAAIAAAAGAVERALAPVRRAGT